MARQTYTKTTTKTVKKPVKVTHTTTVLNLLRQLEDRGVITDVKVGNKYTATDGDALADMIHEIAAEASFPDPDDDVKMGPAQRWVVDWLDTYLDGVTTDGDEDTTDYVSDSELVDSDDDEAAYGELERLSTRGCGCSIDEVCDYCV